MPSLQKKYLKYEQYKKQTITDIFDRDQLQDAVKLDAFNFNTSVLLNNKKGAFTYLPLPPETQFSPVYAILPDDFDGDGKMDLLLAGNFFESKPDVGIYDASYGLYLKGAGNGRFKTMPFSKSGISIRGAVRDIIKIGKSGNKAIYLFALNNDTAKIYSLSR
jgi:hypothetical protein